jgi:HPt (histidine-containing phosphotransfer) domain-containing protein
MDEAHQKLLAELQKVRASYARELPAIIDRVEATWRSLQTRWDADAFGELHRDVHGMAGSGEVFGIADLGPTARTFEQELDRFVESGMTVFSDGKRAEVDEFLARLRYAAESADE